LLKLQLWNVLSNKVWFLSYTAVNKFFSVLDVLRLAVGHFQIVQIILAGSNLSEVVNQRELQPKFLSIVLKNVSDYLKLWFKNESKYVIIFEYTVKPELTATCQQRPARIPCPTKPTMTLPSILDQPLNNGHPLNNSHFFGVPRVAVVHRFDCIYKCRYVFAYKNFWG
jgi:hypothetical protein